MWDSIGKVRENKDDMDLLPAHRNNDPKFAKKSISNAALINVDFSSSTKGLFSGIKHFSINLYSLSYFSLNIQHISSRLFNQNFQESYCFHLLQLDLLYFL